MVEPLMNTNRHAGLEADITLARNGFEVGVQLDIAPGETVAIVGPNGAGKSSIVHALAGLDPVGRGQVTLGGRVLEAPDQGVFVAPHERRIGICFQDALLFPHLSVAENVGFRLIAQGATVHSLVDTWLERVGLGGYGARRVAELSGGQARRVALARAMIGDPDLVVLDEPFAGLDIAVHAGLRRMLQERVAEHRAPHLLITHDPVDAQALADRMLVLEQGHVTQRGTPEEIRRRPSTPFVAELVGVNLLTGHATQGLVALEAGLELAVVDHSIAGDVTVTVPPQAISLHRERPVGSPRNAWVTTVASVHPVGGTVRVQLGNPAALIVDVTPGAVAELGIEPGREFWAAIKATSLEVVSS